MPPRQSFLNAFFPNADVDRLVGALKTTSGASESSRRSGLARLRAADDRDFQEQEAENERRAKLDEVKKNVFMGEVKRKLTAFEKLSDPAERAQTIREVAVMMHHLEFSEEEIGDTLRTMQSRPPGKSAQELEREQLQGKANESLLKDATFESRQTFGGDPSKLEAPEEDIAQFGNVPTQALTALFKNATPESIKRSLAANDLNALEERSEDEERDVRVVGGTILDLTKFNESGNAEDVVILGEFQKKSQSPLARAEGELSNLQKRLQADPENQELAAQTQRAKQQVDNISRDRITPEDTELGDRMDNSRALINDVRELIAGPVLKDEEGRPQLDEKGEPLRGPNDTFGSIAGVTGSFKSFGGGLARSAGIPISTRSKALKRKMKTIAAKLSAIITGEKRVSDTERAAVELIVGQFGALDDELDILTAMDSLELELNRMEGRILNAETRPSDPAFEGMSDEEFLDSLTPEETP